MTITEHLIYSVRLDKPRADGSRKFVATRTDDSRCLDALTLPHLIEYVVDHDQHVGFAISSVTPPFLLGGCEEAGAIVLCRIKEIGR